jgi:hypothetical protein
MSGVAWRMRGHRRWTFSLGEAVQTFRLLVSCGGECDSYEFTDVDIAELPRHRFFLIALAHGVGLVSSAQ